MECVTMPPDIRCNGYFSMPSNFIRLYSVKTLTNMANTHFEGMQMDSF